MYQKKKKRHRAVGIDGSPELQAMEEASRAVLSAHVVVGYCHRQAARGSKGFEYSSYDVQGVSPRTEAGVGK